MNLCELLFKVSDITSQIAVILDNFKAEISKMFGTSLYSIVYFELLLFWITIIMHNSSSP